MGNLTEEYPLSFLFASIGFLIGIFFLLTADFSMSTDCEGFLFAYSCISSYASNFLRTLRNSFLLGISLSILFGLGGLAIDIFKNNRKIENTLVLEKFTGSKF